MSLDTVKAMIALGFREGFRITLIMRPNEQYGTTHFYNCEMIHDYTASRILIVVKDEDKFLELKKIMDRYHRYHGEYFRRCQYSKEEQICLYFIPEVGQVPWN